jgi:hypothetical protein
VNSPRAICSVSPDFTSSTIRTLRPSSHENVESVFGRKTLRSDVTARSGTLETSMTPDSDPPVWPHHCSRSMFTKRNCGSGGIMALGEVRARSAGQDRPQCSNQPCHGAPGLVEADDVVRDPAVVAFEPVDQRIRQGDVARPERHRFENRVVQGSPIRCPPRLTWGSSRGSKCI